MMQVTKRVAHNNKVIATIARQQQQQQQSYRFFFSQSTTKKSSSSNDDDNNNDNNHNHNHNNDDLVQVQHDSNGICHVRLNRPDKLNALNFPLFQALQQVATQLSTTTTTTTSSSSTSSSKVPRVVILSGNGKAFSSGLDVKSFLRHNPIQTAQRLLERPDDNDNNNNDNYNNNNIANLAQAVAYTWRQVPCPVICCLQGMCYGGGLQIALGADIRLATPDCQLSIMETKWGLIPDMSASVTLRELVRIDVAKELTMTGRVVSGIEAAELGLVTRCVDDPQQEALTLANQLLERSPDAIAAAKQLFQKTYVNASEREALQLETELQRKLLPSWNQMAASGRNFGWNIPYKKRNPGITTTGTSKK